VGREHREPRAVIVLCTDFGPAGPYVGQVKAVLARDAPGIPAIDLFADLPPFRPQLAAYLIAAYGAAFAAGDVILAVVDPGVGGAREALAINADGRWYVGPDNGLFEIVLRRAGAAQCWIIDWRPPALSATFHGRDLFAPVAARLARKEPPPGTAAAPTRHPDWPDDLAAIVYVDHYGNAMTGLRASVLSERAELAAAGARIARARTFTDVPPGALLWYANANGLAEIAAHGASAAARLGLAPSMPVAVHTAG
jgi:S-adenosyl-L-methionine hydrolase (adenosine-forming)